MFTLLALLQFPSKPIFGFLRRFHHKGGEILNLIRRETMLTLEQQAVFYGGLLREETVRINRDDWWINTPAIMVEGSRDITVLIQGGIHSEFAQLSHKVRWFVQNGFSVICLSQSGSATTHKNSNFYQDGGLHRFVERDLAILDKFGVGRVITYGSSIGAAASIALAGEYPDRVAAVIAVNPAALIRQNPWWLAIKFVLSSFQPVDKDFVSPPTSPLSKKEAVRELFGGAAHLAASDEGLGYLSQTDCPVLIYTGREDGVFPSKRLGELEDSELLPNVKVVPMVGFVHSDPNSEEKMNRLGRNALRELNQLGIT